MRRSRARMLGPVAAVFLLAACGGAAGAAPTWVPQPNFTGDGGRPQTFGPAESQTPSSSPSPSSGAPSGSPTPSPSPSATQDPQVVATKLTAPTGIALLPDGTALVGERTTGRIVRVQPVAGQPVTTVRTLTGLDPSGDGGLLDLAISPSYGQDGLIYAYLTTPTDNRVVHFTLTGPPTVVLSGIPKGPTGNAARLLFDSDGTLYVGTGAAGQPALATNTASLAGKLLRINDIGQPAAGNPQPASPVYASGFRTVDGLCEDTADNVVFQDQAAAGTDPDQINVIASNANYSGQSGPAAVPAGKTALGGCAVIKNQFYTTSRDGTDVLAATISSTGLTAKLGTLSALGITKYGRLLTVVAAPDGALWLTTSNKDGHGTPGPDDERVLRILPPPPSGSSSPL